MLLPVLWEAVLQHVALVVCILRVFHDGLVAQAALPCGVGQNS